MDLDIADFLPKYPNIEPFENALFNPYEEDFYESIYKKKEFYDERLEKVEAFPSNPGVLMNHQKLIARFLSSYTIYDQLLLVHEMGTGKTCSAVGAIEQIREEHYGFTGALYLARGESLINNFINELIFKCTDGRYVPEGYHGLTALEKVHRKKKAIRDYYMMNTFETFAKEIRGSSSAELKRKYSNKIIVVDEVHNLRMQATEKTLNIYNQFLRFLHEVQDCKILLLSGTPMYNSVKEIASIMNLILPVGEELPTGDAFLAEYFQRNPAYPEQDGEVEEILMVQPEAVEKLKSVFKGRVSFLRAMHSSVDIIYEGRYLEDIARDLGSTGSDSGPSIRFFKATETTMSRFQSQYYAQAYAQDRQKKQGEHGDRTDQGVYANSTQATLFVFPDGTYGDEGFTKFIKKTPRTIGGPEPDGKRKKQLYRYSLTSELRDAIHAGGADTSREQRLRNIGKYSSTYEASIRNILLAQEEGKLVFVYNRLVQGSGLILFGLLLEMFGFSSASGLEADKSERPRYASLTTKTSTDKQVKDLVDRFNRPDNCTGKVINVIVGSRKIAEGFSLQNVQIEEIQTPWFNYSETSQAIARGIRLGSHRMLIDIGIDPSVEIYQRVAVPDNSTESIDLYMYQVSERKDVSIKGVEKIMKESAFDCALTYERNRVDGTDGSRECDYAACNYKCDGIPPEMIGSDVTNDELDYSTYQLYYAQPAIGEIMSEIRTIFRNAFHQDLATLFELFPNYSKFEVLTALRTMIDQSVQITNKYGYSAYLKQESNIFFLVDSLTVTGTILSDYYSEYPHSVLPLTYNQIIDPLYVQSLPGIIKDVCGTDSLEALSEALTRLPAQVHEYILEASILARARDLTANVPFRTHVLAFFENYFANVDGVWVSWLLSEDTGMVRCLRDTATGEWEDCDEYVEWLRQMKRGLQTRMEQNPYGYYGQFSRASNKFCIRDVTGPIAEKKHRRTAGKVCETWTLRDLWDIVIRRLKIPIPTDLNEADRARMNPLLSRDNAGLVKNLEIITKFGKAIRDVPKFVEGMDKDDLLRANFWAVMTKPMLCERLRAWFDAHGLLVEEPGCGNPEKSKI